MNNKVKKTVLSHMTLGLGLALMFTAQAQTPIPEGAVSDRLDPAQLSASR